MNNVETIKPFKNFCMTIGALPTSYLESMSYYETLCWLCKYLENTINPAINNNAEALKELQSYVANYFENLDVQEEINNKLDEMAESGVLADIINEQIFSDLNDDITAVDNKIGDLTNLKTNDKSNIVSAANEIIDKFNMVNFKTWIPSSVDYTTTNCTWLYGQLTFAANSDYSIAKLYGKVILPSDENTSCQLYLQGAIPNGYRPVESFSVNPIGSLEYSTGTPLNSTVYCTFNTSGDININIIKNETESITIGLNAIPFVIFMKNFGD